jgi:trk system potassium uptake protein TrkH
MFTGASPGSTGGGIKTTTMFVLLASLWSRLKGFEDVDLFKKSVPSDIISRAGVIFLLGIGVLGLALFFLFVIEEGNPSIGIMERPFLAILFEGVSAFGTVGLSMGVTHHLSPPSLLVLTILMFVGRVGPLTLFMALSGPLRIRPRHPDELVMVG